MTGFSRPPDLGWPYPIYELPDGGTAARRAGVADDGKAPRKIVAVTHLWRRRGRRLGDKAVQRVAGIVDGLVGDGWKIRGFASSGSGIMKGCVTSAVSRYP